MPGESANNYVNMVEIQWEVLEIFKLELKLIENRLQSDENWNHLEDLLESLQINNNPSENNRKLL